MRLEDRTVPSTITWTNRGQASDRFDSTFGANANLARGVIDAVLDSWERVIVNFNRPGGGNTLNITVSMNSTGTGFGASTSTSLSAGFPVSGAVTIARGNDTTGDGIGDGAGYFLDPTPLDNSEFAGTILHAFTADVQAGSPAFNQSDLFTLAVHEVGHAVGMTGGSSRLQTPINGTVTNTGIPDNSEGGGIGTYRVFDGPSVTHLFTSNNGGPGGQDSGALIHSAGPPGNQPVSFNSAFRGTRQLVGTQDIINPIYEFNRRYLIADYLALVLKDAYNYTIAMPQSFGTFYAMLNQTTGNLLVRGGSGTSADNISVSRSGDNVVVSVDLGTDVAGTGPNGDNSAVGAFVSSFPIASVTSISVQPGGGADTLTVDFTGGNPLPAAGLGYSAGGSTGDNLVVTGASFTAATFNATNSNSGNVNLDGRVITYIGLTAVSAGSLTGTGGSLTKTGTGTLTLTGNNTYTGTTTVNGGTLLVNGSLDAGSAVTVNSGATLGGTGAANGPVTVNLGGNFAPGTSPGLFTAGGVTFVGGAFVAEINGATAGTQYDQLAVNGVVTLSGPLNLTVGFAAPLGTQFRLIDNDGFDPVVGTFTGLLQGATVTVGGQEFTVSYTGGTGNDVVLTRGTAAAAPRVADVDVNAGQADTTQRSRVTSITVTFTAQVTFAGPVADAFKLSRVGGATVGGFTATSDIVGGVTVVTLSGFTGAETRFGSLADGFFTLMVLSDQVSAGGQALDGDGDGTPGGDYAQTGTVANGLFSLYGDVNGDGTVNAFDFSQFRNAFGTSTGDPAYRDFLDYDGSGSINAFDFGQFRNRFGSGVP